MKRYEALNDALVQEGTEIAFALMGDANQDLICDLGERKQIPIIHGCHEQNAVAIADGYSRFSGKIGVATCTPGPGLRTQVVELVMHFIHTHRQHLWPRKLIASISRQTSPGRRWRSMGADSPSTPWCRAAWGANDD